MKTNNAGEEYLRSVKISFEKYKAMCEKTFEQLDENNFHFTIDENTNSIAVIMQHISGNIISRFTDFLTSDGEKPNRNRDSEFEEQNLNKIQLMEKWNNSWYLLLNTLENLSDEDLLKTVYIRNEALSVIESLNRSLTHLIYHIGQIVFLAKYIKKDNWKTLSIPKGKSEEFNKKMAAK
jgi:uncharacterized damage-inducible protein DinB